MKLSITNIELSKGLVKIFTEFEPRLFNAILTDPSKYVCEIKKDYKKRSLDANAYAWVLIGKIAKKINSTPEKVYKKIIYEGAVYEIYPVRLDSVSEAVRKWEASGMGNQTEIIGDSKIRGYKNIKFYYGSSTHNSSEMAHFIDSIIFECNELEIETKISKEIQDLKDNWN